MHYVGGTVNTANKIVMIIISSSVSAPVTCVNTREKNNEIPHLKRVATLPCEDLVTFIEWNIIRWHMRMCVCVRLCTVSFKCLK